MVCSKIMYVLSKKVNQKKKKGNEITWLNCVTAHKDKLTFLRLKRYIRARARKRLLSLPCWLTDEISTEMVKSNQWINNCSWTPVCRFLLGTTELEGTAWPETWAHPQQPCCFCVVFPSLRKEQDPQVHTKQLGLGGGVTAGVVPGGRPRAWFPAGSRHRKEWVYFLFCIGCIRVSLLCLWNADLECCIFKIEF